MRRKSLSCELYVNYELLDASTFWILMILPKTKTKGKMTEYYGLFFTFCFNGYCFSIGMRIFTDCACTTCVLECCGLLNIYNISSGL